MQPQQRRLPGLDRDLIGNGRARRLGLEDDEPVGSWRQWSRSARHVDKCPGEPLLLARFQIDAAASERDVMQIGGAAAVGLDRAAVAQGPLQVEKGEAAVAGAEIGVLLAELAIRS